MARAACPATTSHGTPAPRIALALTTRACRPNDTLCPTRPLRGSPGRRDGGAACPVASHMAREHHASIPPPLWPSRGMRPTQPLLPSTGVPCRNAVMSRACTTELPAHGLPSGPRTDSPSRACPVNHHALTQDSPHVALLAYCTSAQPHHAKWGWQCQCRPARRQQSMALRAPRLAGTTIPGQACPSTPSPPARLRYTPTSMPRRAMEPPSPKSPSPDRPARSRGLADSGCSTQWL